MLDNDIQVYAWLQIPISATSDVTEQQSYLVLFALLIWRESSPNKLVHVCVCVCVCVWVREREREKEREKAEGLDSVFLCLYNNNNNNNKYYYYYY